MEVFFMKKGILFCACTLSILLSACQNDTAREEDKDIYQESGNTINVNDQRADIYNKDPNGKINENFGYVRHQKSPIKGEEMNNAAIIDREKLADTISKACTNLPNVEDAATLVTDEEVLVIYDADTDDRNLTADQVNKTAMAFVPRWYRIYVSDNTNLRNTMESYSYLDSDSRNAETGIDKLIQEMVKSPQGKPISNRENANGIPMK